MTSRACSTRSVVELSKRRVILRRCGEEMLVITNPATQAAADQFADRASARRAAGRSVVQIGAAAGQIGTTHDADPDVHPRPPDGAAAASTRATSRSWATTTSCRRSRRAQRHPVRSPVLDEDRRRRAARRRDRPHPRQRPGRRRRRAVTKIIGYETTRADRARHAHQGDRRRAVPGRRQRRPGEPHVHPVRRDRPQRAHGARRRRRPRSTGSIPGNNPQRFQDGTPAAGRAAEADVRLERHRRAGQRRLERRAASWSFTATTAGPTAGARRATAPPTSRR